MAKASPHHPGIVRQHLTFPWVTLPVTPGISAQEYANRREKLAARLPSNSLAIIAASEVKYRSGAVFYPFHQDPDFFYLTGAKFWATFLDMNTVPNSAAGFNEPEALAVIDGQHVFHLFVRPKDAAAELWEGTRSGMQAALDVFNADETGDINRVESLLRDILSSVDKVYTDLVGTTSHTARFANLFRKPQKDGIATLLEKSKVKALRPHMNELRAIKSESEIANMRTAGKASGRAITNAMRQRFSTEKSLAAFLEYNFKENGCDSSAYVPVVAGGENALTIHYVRNDDVLRKVDGQLVLVDAGGQYGGYAADITRCWPVNGQFSPAQKDLYEAVLRVQRSCVSLCRQDANISLAQLHEIAEKGLRDQLRQLKFDVSGEVGLKLPIKAAQVEFGMAYGNSRLYELCFLTMSGITSVLIFTTPRDIRLNSPYGRVIVSPLSRIYVPNDDRWPAAFRGMAIQIEDSVCVQEEGPLVLSTEAVKELISKKFAAE
ncbi:MAG: hypothetical protein M1816_004564 [Peltula sp. TS41687]|nr:MAG: hypothetical protein M1816_004564 [Peltula sp. TS41687]